MNKSELIKALADETNIPLDDASLVVNTFFDAMKKSLLSGSVLKYAASGALKSRSTRATPVAILKPAKASSLNRNACPFSGRARN